MWVVPEGFPVAGSFSDLLEKRAAGNILSPQWQKGGVVPRTTREAMECYNAEAEAKIKQRTGAAVKAAAAAAAASAAAAAGAVAAADAVAVDDCWQSMFRLRC